MKPQMFRDLVRWLQRQRPARRRPVTDSVQSSTHLEYQPLVPSPPITPPDPQSREEFQDYLSKNDREMAYIQEVVSSIRQERLPPLPPGTSAESASR
jgi:hypothetical protein